jgi:hypothetical protein
MKTKIYLKDVEDTGDISRIQREEGLYWFRTSQDEKGIFFVVEGRLEKDKLGKYLNIMNIEYLD